MGIDTLIKKFFDDNKKDVKRLEERVKQINALEDGLKALSDDELRWKTDEFKQRLEQGETLDDLLNEAFAVVREASYRVLGMRQFDVQLMGGIVLHQGRIAEMKTGEGKTLVATAPVYLNALTGQGVHVITVNDYLASRDAELMGKVYNFLGMSVGLIVHGLSYQERKAAYLCDITYGTNNEFGFDYLRDNMVNYLDNMVQRDLNYVIIDEVDSILIDEARTPLIISGAISKPRDLYTPMAQVIRRLREEDYTFDEKLKNVSFTEEGAHHLEQLLGVDNITDPEHVEILHHANQALKAEIVMKRDRDYVVNNGEVVIVDEFTGRLMYGRRYSEGLHQAIEAKEGVKIEKESQTLATITFQNYFRMYKKIAGMTGTAKTEEDEFRSIYGMDVVIIPTNKPIARQDKPDIVYRSENGKFEAVAEKVEELYRSGQPVLVGTVSIEKSEKLSEILKRHGVPHQVLNAKYHEQEAEIVAGAGQRGMVTIATNMAGRGTDIVLGEGIADIGGLYIIGTERHESRRIDNQLRGRAGRQGDPGVTHFYISLEDDLMRRFGAEYLPIIMDKVGMDDSMPIENRVVSRTIENAQKRVESRNFEARKYVLEYDDIMNKQREIVYGQRRQILKGERLDESIQAMISEIGEYLVAEASGMERYPEEWNLEGLKNRIQEVFALKEPVDIEAYKTMEAEEVIADVQEKIHARYFEKEEEIGSEIFHDVERSLLIRNVDEQWMQHLDAMDQMRQGIGLRAYANHKPIDEYRNESYTLFNDMSYNIQYETIRGLCHLTIREEEELLEEAQKAERTDILQATHGDEVHVKKPVVKKDKVGRNEPCPCGSGEKYKHCCGK